MDGWMDGLRNTSHWSTAWSVKSKEETVCLSTFTISVDNVLTWGFSPDQHVIMKVQQINWITRNVGKMNNSNMQRLPCALCHVCSTLRVFEGDRVFTDCTEWKVLKGAVGQCGLKQYCSWRWTQSWSKGSNFSVLSICRCHDDISYINTEMVCCHSWKKGDLRLSISCWKYSRLHVF